MIHLRDLRQICRDTKAGREDVLRQARRALEYGATARQVETVCGHWPRGEDLAAEAPLS